MDRRCIAEEPGRTAWVVGAALREWDDQTPAVRAHVRVVCQSVLRGEGLTTAKFRKVSGCSHNVWEIKHTKANMRFFAVKDGPDLYIGRIVKKPAKSEVIGEADLAFKRASPYLGT